MARQGLVISKIRRSLACRKGQSVVEFTFAFLIFFAVFMAIVEFSHLLYSKVTLQHALRTAGRYMITGRTGQDAQGQDIPRPEMIHKVFCSNLIAAGVQCPALGSDNFRFECINDDGNAVGCASAGGADQTVIVTVNVVKPALMPFFSQFFPDGGVPFQLSTTWKNEPFTT